MNCISALFLILSKFDQSRFYMRLPTLFKQNKNKSFNYTYRFYDERKERLDNLKRKHGLIEDDSPSKGYRRQSFRDDWKQTTKAVTDRNSRVRLFVILAFLFLTAFVALNYLDIKLY